MPSSRSSHLRRSPSPSCTHPQGEVASSWAHGFRYKTAAMYVLPVLAILGIWYFLLFVGNSSGTTPKSTFVFVLTEGPMPWWYAWLLVLPVLCCALAAAYLSGVASSSKGAVSLFGLGVALAASAWITVSPEIALFVTLPLWYSFQCIRERAQEPPCASEETPR